MMSIEYEGIRCPADVDDRLLHHVEAFGHENPRGARGPWELWPEHEVVAGVGLGYNNT